MPTARRLALTWGKRGDVSWVNVDLAPLADGGTRLRLEHDTWPTGDGGKAFVTQSSEAWADASIASGTDETAARAGAKRITAMYTSGA